MTELAPFPTRHTGHALDATDDVKLVDLPTDRITALPLHGDSIRAKPPYKVPPKLPTAMYFIRFTTEADGTPRAQHLYDPKITNPKIAEDDLYALAKQGGYEIAWDFDTLIWRAPTYISIVLDVDDHKFYWRDPEGFDPILFVQYKERDVGTQTVLFEYQPNYSFYDAELVDLDVGGGKKRPLLRFVNYHRKNRDGDPLLEGDHAIPYCMNIQLLAKYKGGKVWKHIIDPDSENQGPGGGP